MTTNFSYFLDKYPFCVQSSIDVFPKEIRTMDPELDVSKSGQAAVDKAMTVLGVVEDQVREMIAPNPFIPTDFGFLETEAEGDSEHEKTLVYVKSDNPTLHLEAHVDKAMTYTAIRHKAVFRPTEQFPTETDLHNYLSTSGDNAPLEESPYDLIPDVSIELFLPNAVVGSIVLQSIGFLPLANPSGVYHNELKEQGSAADVEPHKHDPNTPVKLWPWMTWPTEEDRAKFEEENNWKTTKNIFLTNSAINSLRQVRMIRSTYKEYKFTNVEEAIMAHDVFTEEQKQMALKIWREGNDQPQIVPEEFRDKQQEYTSPIEAPKKPVEPCPKCNGTGHIGVDLKCPWCIKSPGKKDDSMQECPDCVDISDEQLVTDGCLNCMGTRVCEIPQSE